MWDQITNLGSLNRVVNIYDGVIMWLLFISAIGLLFVFEGIMPFLSPPAWRQLMQHMVLQSDRGLRIMGLISMLVGLGLICLIHNLS